MPIPPAAHYISCPLQPHLLYNKYSPVSAHNIDPCAARFRQLCGGGAVVRTLADIRRGEDERREAAGVLAQVLSPWIEGNTLAGDTGVQDTSLPDIVISLKGESCQHTETVLCFTTTSTCLYVITEQ